LSRFTCRPNWLWHRLPKRGALFAALFQRLPASATACPPSGSTMLRRRTDDTLLCLDGPPAGRGRGSSFWKLATGGKPRVPPIIAVPASPFESSRRSAPLPCDDETSRNCSVPSMSPGRSGRSSFHPRSKGTGRPRLYRAGANLRFSRDRQDYRSLTPGPPILRARTPAPRVLLTTFSDTLANALRPN